MKAACQYEWRSLRGCQTIHAGCALVQMGLHTYACAGAAAPDPMAQHKGPEKITRRRSSTKICCLLQRATQKPHTNKGVCTQLLGTRCSGQPNSSMASSPMRCYSICMTGAMNARRLMPCAHPQRMQAACSSCPASLQGQCAGTLVPKPKARQRTQGRVKRPRGGQVCAVRVHQLALACQPMWHYTHPTNHARSDCILPPATWPSPATGHRENHEPAADARIENMQWRGRGAKRDATACRSMGAGSWAASQQL